MLSLYYDGHANLFKSVFAGKGKYWIILIGVFLFVSQTIIFGMYLNSQLDASLINKVLIFLNFAAPSTALLVMVAVVMRFSGSPIRAAIYS